MKVRRLMVITFAAFSFAYVLLAGVIYFKQESLLFNPDPVRRAPQDVGIGNAEVLNLKTPDGESLVAWYTAACPGKPTILFLHGKGGAISGRPQRYAHYTGHGYGVLFLEYRGFGGSTGIPSEKGLVTDVRTAYDWLIARGIGASRIAVVGESLGTGFAVKLAAEVPVAAVALESPYLSMTAIARTRYWWLPVDLLIHNPIDAGAVMAKYKGPVLMQHGDMDQTIPMSIGRDLYERAVGPKDFVVIRGAGHFIYTPETFDRELEFFARYAQ